MTTLKLVKTCNACPEQYEVYLEDVHIGYLRLRHGYFRADYPDCGGETVYESDTKGDGVFEGDERQLHLTLACQALLTRHITKQPIACRPLVTFTVEEKL